MENQAVLSEDILVAEARAGNQDAFTELVRRHSGKIFGVSLRMLKNREDAEDNLQNVLFKAYHNLGRFEGQSQFSTWLFRITINEALMKLRRHQSERQATYSDVQSNGLYGNYPEIEDKRQNHEREYINRELADIALRGLNPSLKNTFVLQKAEGWTNRELAGALGITVETVKSRIFRARTRSRRRLEIVVGSGTVAA
ncbi:MAG TPA: sigma-70 family RNA polymerase sigma factor [Candidatus Dormibacteraeota bacterium]|nr:sigma-70 family RNA polymerase sigma factor [Candidatus Dormibacteraeota bacterium]